MNPNKKDIPIQTPYIPSRFIQNKQRAQQQQGR